MNYSPLFASVVQLTTLLFLGVIFLFDDVHNVCWEYQYHNESRDS